MEYLGQNNFFDFFVEYESRKYRQYISRNIYKKYSAHWLTMRSHIRFRQHISELL